MGTDLDRLRDEIASLLGEITDLRVEVALLRGAQPVIWRQFQPFPDTFGVLPPQVIYLGTAQPWQTVCGQTFAATACAAPVPQIQTFTAYG